jgi:hypothetical protein
MSGCCVELYDSLRGDVAQDLQAPVTNTVLTVIGASIGAVIGEILVPIGGVTVGSLIGGAIGSSASGPISEWWDSEEARRHREEVLSRGDAFWGSENTNDVRQAVSNYVPDNLRYNFYNMRDNNISPQTVDEDFELWFNVLPNLTGILPITPDSPYPGGATTYGEALGITLASDPFLQGQLFSSEERSEDDSLYDAVIEDPFLIEELAGSPILTQVIIDLMASDEVKGIILSELFESGDFLQLLRDALGDMTSEENTIGNAIRLVVTELLWGENGALNPLRKTVIQHGKDLAEEKSRSSKDRMDIASHKFDIAGLKSRLSSLATQTRSADNPNFQTANNMGYGPSVSGHQE